MTEPQISQPPANALSAWLARAETVLVALAAASLAAIMCVVMADVILRYLFDAPLTWSYDLIGLYLIGGVFFFSLSDTMHHHGHIALDVFVPLLPRWLRHGAQALGYGVSALLIGAITWLEYDQGASAFWADDRIAAPVPLPTWVAHGVLALGMAVLTLRCAHRAIFHAASIFSADDLVELPPPPITSGTTTEPQE
ncbi:MAG: TRAP transporter small permease [Vannielia sp.]|uniref:TRAP transporter small permease n=1 Tax=Vannielia sp. TaxID=2813045 RepID=UPI003B8E53A4